MKKIEIVIATNNEHKLKEFREIFAQYPVIFKSLKDEGINVDPDENGKTYAENAYIKAYEVSKYTNKLVISDDSGIEIEALGEHFPGIFSHRYSISNGGYEKSNVMLAKKYPNSKARFTCAICLIDQNKNVHYFEGIVEGKIASQVSGTQGFGYDPIFIPNGYEKPIAEYDSSIKNKISHRYRASKKLIKYLFDKKI